MLNLIPAVKNITIRDGFLAKSGIRFEEMDLDRRLLNALKTLPREKTGADILFQIAPGNGEGYTLTINENDICIAAQGLAGAFYAIQTLRQIFTHPRIPCLTIEDAPDFPHRGFYHDVTRGKLPTVDTIKQLIDRMAYYKLNSLQLYVEHTFAFDEYKGVHATTGCLTPDDLRQIKEYCCDNFIDFVPSLSTFGHLYELLEQPQYRHLRALRDYQPDPNFWYGRMRHHTISPENPESIALIKSLIDQYVPHFDSEWFNICCDETFDLKYYDTIGMDSGTLYVEFVKKIIEHIKSHGKKVMMWGDILLKYPHVIDQLPDDVCFLNWYYHENPPEENIRCFAQSGKAQIVCPGTTTWNRLCEHVVIEEQNICRMAEYGYRHGAFGVLNTNWGDWGNPCCVELAMYGMVLGAEKAWSVKTEVSQAFYDRVNHLLYQSGKGIACLKALSEMHSSVSWRTFAANYFAHRYQTGQELKETVLAPVEQIQEAYLSLRAELTADTWAEDEYRQEMLISAEGVCLMAELSYRLAGKPCQRITETENWLAAYRQKWMNKNKPYELERIEEMFRYYEAL